MNREEIIVLIYHMFCGIQYLNRQKLPVLSSLLHSDCTVQPCHEQARVFPGIPISHLYFCRHPHLTLSSELTIQVIFLCCIHDWLDFLLWNPPFHSRHVLQTVNVWFYSNIFFKMARWFTFISLISFSLWFMAWSTSLCFDICVVSLL